jgi:MFS family permease
MNFFLNAACSVISPFYPSLASGSLYKPSRLKLTDLEIGLVFSMHPVGGFLFGLVVAKFMEQIGRRTLMWTSLVVTVITLIALGLSYYLRQ